MTALPMTLMTDDEVAMFGRATADREPGFGALSCARGVLPLVAMDVDARVVGVIAAIELAQTFTNNFGEPIEATYIFPLPDRAAVHRFRMQVGDRVIEGVVDERGAARQQYEDAIASGHRAAITEEERPGVFTLRVGNLMPGESATIKLSLVGPVVLDDGELTLRFPLVVAQRYIPGGALGGDQAGLGSAADTSAVPDASRISPPVLLRGYPNPVRLGIRVALADPGIRELASSLHAVTELSAGGDRVVAIQPGERLDRDFILRWRNDAPMTADRSGAIGLATSLRCADDADGAGGTFMLTVIPSSTTAALARPRDVVFVLDRSGSMNGWRMVAARRATARMIDTLTARDRFSVLAFDDVVEEVPAPGLVDATDRNRFRAVEALAAVDARNGTELAKPLRDAVTRLAGGPADRERVVVLITDGQVGNEDQILRELGGKLQDVRVFTLGIDKAVNAAFLRRLASAGGGLCELVESEDRLDAVMAKIHRRIGTPIATGLTLVAHGLELERGSQTPSPLADVYAGAPVVVLGRYHGAAPAQAALELRGHNLGEVLSASVSRTADASPAPWLGATWARAKIRDLEDAYAVSSADELERRIVEISRKFSVLSRFTAFLAVDRSEVVNPGGGLRQVVQAVESTLQEPQMDMARMRSKKAGPAPGAAARPMMSRAAPSPMASMPPAMPPPSPAMPASPMRNAPMPPSAAAYMPPQSQMPPPSPLGGSYGSAAGGPPVPPREEIALPAAVNDGSAFRSQLATLARELAAQAAARADVAVIRVLRQRLTEWLDDVRAIGELATLVAVVEPLLVQLSAALATPGTLAAHAEAIATELARIAAATPSPTAPVAPPTTTPTPKRKSFWK